MEKLRVAAFRPMNFGGRHDVGRKAKGARDRARCGQRCVHRVLGAGTSSRAAPRLSKSACATSCGRLFQEAEGPVESLVPPHPGVDPYSIHLSAFTPRPLPTAAAAAATAPSRTRNQALPVHGIDALSSFDKPVAGRHRGRRAEGGATAHVDDPAHRAA